jgi:hypothetical protein
MLQSFYPYSFANVFRHYKYMNAALYNRIVPSSSKVIPHLVDHRYFYDKYDIVNRRVGYYTCGVSRDAVSPMLLANKVLFGDADFLKSLSDFINNPSVTGYMIEQAVLASIAFNGLAVASRIHDSMEVNIFQELIPNLAPKTNRPVLHIPKIFNYKGVDGIIVKKEPPIDEEEKQGEGKKQGEEKKGEEEKRGKQRLFVYPLQMTMAKKHKDSHKTFFDEWKSWIATLEEFDVIPEFIWISKNGGIPKKHKQTDEWPEHLERDISIGEVNRKIKMTYEIEKRGGLIQQGPEILAGPQKRSTRSGAGGGKGSGEQPRADGTSAAAADTGGTNDYMGMEKRQLKAMAKSRGLHHTGTKKEIAARLEQDDKKKEGARCDAPAQVPGQPATSGA